MINKKKIENKTYVSKAAVRDDTRCVDDDAVFARPLNWSMELN